MNIKEFLVLCIHKQAKNQNGDIIPFGKFPMEINYIILENIRKDAALVIQRYFFYKVKKNTDIFLELIDIHTGYPVPVFFVNRILHYAIDNVSFSYIQDPNRWLDYIEGIVYDYQAVPDFNVSSANLLINMIISKSVAYHTHYSINSEIENLMFDNYNWNIENFYN